MAPTKMTAPQKVMLAKLVEQNPPEDEELDTVLTVEGTNFRVAEDKKGKKAYVIHDGELEEEDYDDEMQVDSPRADPQQSKPAPAKKKAAPAKKEAEVAEKKTKKAPVKKSKPETDGSEDEKKAKKAPAKKSKPEPESEPETDASEDEAEPEPVAEKKTKKSDEAVEKAPRKRRDPNKPKREREKTAFNMFVSERMMELKEKIPIGTDRFREACSMWKSYDEVAKNNYKEMWKSLSKEGKEQYADALKKKYVEAMA